MEIQMPFTLHDWPPVLSVTAVAETTGSSASICGRYCRMYRGLKSMERRGCCATAEMIEIAQGPS